MTSGSAYDRSKYRFELAGMCSGPPGREILCRHCRWGRLQERTSLPNSERLVEKVCLLQYVGGHAGAQYL